MASGLYSYGLHDKEAGARVQFVGFAGMEGQDSRLRCKRHDVSVQKGYNSKSSSIGYGLYSYSLKSDGLYNHRLYSHHLDSLYNHGL